MNSLQSLLIDMRVDLRCRNISVTQHFLDDAQVGAIPQQMRRKAVSKKVRVNVLLKSGASRKFLYDLPDTHRC